MNRLTPKSLSAMRDKIREEQAIREGRTRATVTVHMGTCGISAGARDVMMALLEALEKRNISDVHVASSGCAGMCSREPMATVQLHDEAPVKYVDLDAKGIVRVLEEHVLGGKIVEDLAIARGSEQTG